MARPFQSLKDINDIKDLWRVAIKVKDIWFTTKEGKKLMEMVVFDKEGTHIEVKIGGDLTPQFEKMLKINKMYTVSNFNVLLNNGTLKTTTHKWIIRFVACTVVEDFSLHQIPDVEPSYYSLKSISNGKFPFDLLIDIIGVVHEVGYTNVSSLPNKAQINFIVKDVSCENMVHCTLWGKFAMALIDYNFDNKNGSPTIIVLKYAKVKPATDRYPITVSNAWSGTQLFINTNLPFIPSELLIEGFNDPLHATVQSTYPSLFTHYNSTEYLQSRAILASTIHVVDEINNYILSCIPGEEHVYLSSDSIDQSEINDTDVFGVLTPEFLNNLSTSGLPSHKITLKVGTPVMLMRNLDQAEGLCNGTRLIITHLDDHVIAGKIISGKNIGYKHTKNDMFSISITMAFHLE